MTQVMLKNLTIRQRQAYILRFCRGGGCGGLWWSNEGTEGGKLKVWETESTPGRSLSIG
jgi:hypothetical protein